MCTLHDNDCTTRKYYAFIWKITKKRASPLLKQTLKTPFPFDNIKQHQKKKIRICFLIFLTIRIATNQSKFSQNSFSTHKENNCTKNNCKFSLSELKGRALYCDIYTPSHVCGLGSINFPERNLRQRFVVGKLSRCNICFKPQNLSGNLKRWVEPGGIQLIHSTT